MKNYVKVLSLLIICICLCASFFACNSTDRVDESQVEKIELGKYAFSESEVKQFIELFNSAAYEGEGTGIGGTPDYIIEVYIDDGSYLRVNQFGSLGYDFEVFRYNDGKRLEWYYVNSEELKAFVSELINQ